MFLLRIEICFSIVSLAKGFLTLSSMYWGSWLSVFSDTERSSRGNAHGKDTVKMAA